MRVLVATDGSESARRAVEFTSRLVRPWEGLEVIILHVVRPFGTWWVEPNPAVPHPKGIDLAMEAYERDVRERGAQVLAQAAETFEASGAKVESVLGRGDAATEILALAEERKVDLIVMGSRGLGAFQRVILGSVSLRVMQAAKCPVLVVK